MAQRQNARTARAEGVRVRQANRLRSAEGRTVEGRTEDVPWKGGASPPLPPILSPLLVPGGELPPLLPRLSLSSSSFLESSAIRPDIVAASSFLDCSATPVDIGMSLSSCSFLDRSATPPDGLSFFTQNSKIYPTPVGPHRTSYRTPAGPYGTSCPTPASWSSPGFLYERPVSELSCGPSWWGRPDRHVLGDHVVLPPSMPGWDHHGPNWKTSTSSTSIQGGVDHELAGVELSLPRLAELAGVQVPPPVGGAYVVPPPLPQGATMKMFLVDSEKFSTETPKEVFGCYDPASARVVAGKDPAALLTAWLEGERTTSTPEGQSDEDYTSTWPRPPRNEVTGTSWGQYRGGPPRRREDNITSTTTNGGAGGPVLAPAGVMGRALVLVPA